MLARERIKEYRIRRGLTAGELGELIQVKQTTISRYESGSIRRIPYEKLEKMAEVFQCDVDELIKGDPGYHQIDNKEAENGSRLVTDPDLLCLLDWYEALPSEQKLFIRQITSADASNAKIMVICNSYI